MIPGKRPNFPETATTTLGAICRRVDSQWNIVTRRSEFKHLLQLEFIFPYKIDPVMTI